MTSISPVLGLSAIASPPSLRPLTAADNSIDSTISSSMQHPAEWCQLSVCVGDRLPVAEAASSSSSSSSTITWGGSMPRDTAYLVSMPICQRSAGDRGTLSTVYARNNRPIIVYINGNCNLNWNTLLKSEEKRHSVN